LQALPALQRVARVLGEAAAFRGEPDRAPIAFQKDRARLFLDGLTWQARLARRKCNERESVRNICKPS
jgi:hypothetical protein